MRGLATGIDTVGGSEFSGTQATASPLTNALIKPPSYKATASLVLLLHIRFELSFKAPLELDQIRRERHAVGLELV